MSNNIRLLLAEPEDSKEIYDVMMAGYESHEDKTLFVPDEYENIVKYLRSDGFFIKAVNESGRIVGFFMVKYPGTDEDNLGRDIGLSEKEQMKVAHMESVAILPEARGLGLQTKMMLEAERHIDGEYKYLMATVSPYNPASYISTEKAGYENVLTKEKYGGKLRRIYLKKR